MFVIPNAPHRMSHRDHFLFVMRDHDPITFVEELEVRHNDRNHHSNGEHAADRTESTNQLAGKGEGNVVTVTDGRHGDKSVPVVIIMYSDNEKS